MTLVVGLDVGTQSVKLVALDVVSRQIVATHGRPLQLIAAADGTREQLPQWWIDAVRGGIPSTSRLTTSVA